MKYIDAEDLLKEIKRLERATHKSALDCADSETRKFHEGKALAYQFVGILIDSLQQEQPEVDLEQEISSYFKGWTETDEGIACHYQYVNLNTCHAIAHHFYELGLKARKEG